MSMEKLYEISVELTFHGKVFVRAPSKDEARMHIERNWGAVLGPVSSSDDNVQDWDISTHPDNTKVKSVKVRRRGKDKTKKEETTSTA